MIPLLFRLLRLGYRWGILRRMLRLALRAARASRRV